MKKLTLYILSIVGLLILNVPFTGCSDNDKDNAINQIILSESEKNIALVADGETHPLSFTASSSWTALLEKGATSSDDWITVDKSSGISGKASINITTTANNSDAMRTATLTITCGNAVVTVTISQEATTVKTMNESDITDFNKYYKPKEFDKIDMLRSDAKWSWFRSKQSEHFFVFWEAGFGSNPNADTISVEMRVNIDDLLKKAEQYYKTNIETLKFAETGNGKSYLDKYKMEIYLLYQTEWLATGAGYDNVIGALWVNPSTCQPVGSTIAHEIGHSFQYQVYCDKVLNGATDDSKQGFRYSQGNGSTFWEQCAQWQSFQDYPDQVFTSYDFNVWLTNYHRHFDHEWMRYASYWLPYYWVQKHGIDAVAKVWQQSVSPEDPIQAYTRIFCGNQWEVMTNELYDYASHMATYDIDRIRNYSEGYSEKYSTKFYPANEGYYQVAYASCPGTTGFNVIALNVPAAGTEISADFIGLMPGSALAANDPGQYKESSDETYAGTVTKYNSGQSNIAGWKYGFVALKNNGERVYGDMSQNNSGKISFTVPTNTQKVFFVVLGSPKSYNAHAWDEKELNDEQWPYKVKFGNTDLLGNVVIDPTNVPGDVTLTYDLSFAADASAYSGTSVSLNDNGDISKIAQAFVMQPALISSAMLAAKSSPEEGKIAFAAVKADASLDYATTANGYGFWYDSDGNSISWGDNSFVFAEFDNSTFTFTIGQYPGKCTAGDKFTIKEALIYTKSGKQYKATIIFNITIQ